MSDERRPSTHAAELDGTSWDYSPANDGRFLLAPAGRIFASVSWEFRPQHLGMPVAPRFRVVERQVDRDLDTQPLEPLRLRSSDDSD